MDDNTRPRASYSASIPATTDFHGVDGRVLLVDDSSLCRKLMIKTLSSVCTEVIEAKDGSQALEMAASEYPDLILLDVEMPGLNGFEVCSRLKSDESTKSIPIVFLSAEEDADQKNKAFEIGASDYVTKSSHTIEIRARVKMHLAMGLLQKQLRQSEAMHRAIVDTVVAGIVTVDTDGVVHSFNNAAERIFGYTRDEVIGKNVADFLPDTLVKSYAAPVQHVVMNSDREILGRHLEIDGLRKDGSVFPMDLYLSEVGINEKSNRFACIVHDGTARRRAEEVIEQQRDDQRLINDLLSIEIEGGSLQSQLKRALAVVLKARWLGTNPMGGVFLCDINAPETLQLAAQDCLRTEIVDGICSTKSCEVYPPLCSYNSISSHDGSDDKQQFVAPILKYKLGMSTIPVFSADNFLGVILLSLPERSKQSGSQVRLLESVADIFASMIDRDRAQQQLDDLNRELVEASREAGMAMVANNVLHNVGNVLNSVNVSAEVIRDRIQNSKVSGVGKVVGLMESHADDLGSFLSSDEKGLKVFGYLSDLAQHLTAERDEVLSEIGELNKRVDHIKQIVTMQQSYAGQSGVIELVSVSDLLEDAIRMNEASFIRHEIGLVRDYEDIPHIMTDKHKLLQILVNLIRNARHAMCEHEQSERAELILRLRKEGDDAVSIEIQDNGIGISEKNLAKIFASGFTTKKKGKGFGLHASVLSAKEMNGSLSAVSKGTGRGATFTVRLPMDTQHERAAA